jgi:hypothetical protein
MTATADPYPAGHSWPAPSTPSLLWRPIDRLPSVTSRPEPERPGAELAEPDALATFAASTRRWEGTQVALPPAASFGFWVIGAASLLLGGWTAAVLLGTVSCANIVCSVVLLGDHPRLVLVLAGGCVLALAAAAVPTGGLTRADGYQLALLALSAVAGVSALLGVVLAVVGTAVAILAAGGLIFAFIDR